MTIADQLAHYATLEADWDSYGAAKPDAQALETAARVLAAHPDVRHTAPISTGGMFIEWRTERGELSIETFPDGRLRGYLSVVYRSDGSESIEEDERPLTDDVLTLLLERIK